MTAPERLERRGAVELRATGRDTLEGYAAVFDAPSLDLGGFTETIQAGAFTETLTRAGRVMAFWQHDRRHVLGRVGSGTLRLAQDSRGLYFSLDMPDTSTGRDVAELVRRGDVAGASFGFQVVEGGERWETRQGKPHRTLTKLDLYEITITSEPAYPDTTVALRALHHAKRPVLSQFNRLLVRTYGAVQ